MGLILMLGVGVFVYKTKPPVYVQPTTAVVVDEIKPDESTKVVVVDSTNSFAELSGITLSDIAQHDSKKSCWSAVNGNVYDLTSWIPNHPGGEQAILSMCGKDGSNAYNAQHGGRAKQAAILAGFKIGVLTK